ncbi:MAG TPA: Fic family protein [Dysgonamonadaceae bacterium]|nr:Fic family protein [Dysgonamonadaceae bacterium]
MMSDKILYITYEEVMNVYEKTIEKSGGGLSGVLDKGKIESIIEFIQNDDYYPDFVSKLNYLVFRFCSGHCFQDGNKRVALTLGAYFLHKNGHYWAAVVFMKRLEAIIYHIAAGSVDQELSHQIMKNIVACSDFDEELKIEIIHAMSNNQLFEED